MPTEIIVTGIRLSSMPEHPTDQSPCIVEKCQRCEADMWVSEKKRMMRAKSNPNDAKTLCWECVIELAPEYRKLHDSIAMIDLTHA